MIEVSGLCKSYGGHRGVDDVSFTAPRGVITGFVGPNGAGKSTVLRAIAGLLAPDAGVARIDGVAPGQLREPGRALGVYLSADDLPVRATAHGALKYVCDVQGIDHDDAEAVLRLLGLGDVGDRTVKTFSMGMRQRLGIAAAVLSRPSSIVLDEPLNGLDPEGIHWVRAHLRRLAQEGAAVLLSSHVMSELAQTADRIVMIDQGRVVANGTLEEFLVAEGGSEAVFVEATDAEAARHAFATRGLDYAPSERGFVVNGVSAPAISRIVFEAGSELVRLYPVTRTLEETYFGRLAKASGEEARA